MKTSTRFSLVKRFGLFLICLGGLLLPAAPGLAASGKIYVFTSNPALEEGTNNFAGFLRGLGYTVTVLPNPGGSPYEILDVIGTTNAAYQAELIAELTTNYDLLIIHRNYGSSTLASSPAEVAIWNNLKVPILCANAPYVRNNRWKWVDTVNSGSIASPKELTFIYPDHPIVAGLNADLFVTNNVPAGYGGAFNVDASTPEGGPYMQAIAQANVIYSPLCLAVWDEDGGATREFYAGSGQTYTHRRVFFEMHEYRKEGSWGDISWNGNRLWANAVAYAMTGTVPPAPPAIGDYDPMDGSQYNLTATTFSFQTTSPQTIPTSGIQVVVNGHDVSSSLSFAGTPTSRTVSYNGLVPNQVYNVSISVSNAAGVNLASVQFDTFDPAKVVVLYPDFIYPDLDIVFTGYLSAGNYRAFMQSKSSTPQVPGLSQTSPYDPSPTPLLKGVFYLPGSMTAHRLFPLSDAMRNQVIVRVTEDAVSFVSETLADMPTALYLVPAPDAPATILPTLGKAVPHPDQTAVSVLAAVHLDLVDGDTQVTPGSVQLFLDDMDVTSAAQTSINDTASGVSVNHAPPNFLTPGTVHTVKVMYADNAAHSFTNEYSFFTETMPVLPPALALPPTSGISTGFNLRISMAPNHPDPVFQNTVDRAEKQLAGLLAGPSGPVTNAISGSTSASACTETKVINYKQRADDANEGKLGGDVVFPFGDVVLPSQLALEATTYLQLPSGVVTFGVASDDGFRLYGGYGTNLVLGTYDGSRGAQVPSEFPVLVYQAGLYPVRLVYYDGGGGASLEFYTANNASAPNTLGRVLVNGTDDSDAVLIRAYRAAPPTLGIQPDAGGLTISWDGAGDFRLMRTSQLNPAAWEPVGQSPIVEGWRHVVNVTPPSGGSEFYRLELQP
ncbi:MAG: hypothetical protein KA191_17295 [Verrucomicrobia bacterium]|jgi:hypothetical protein|nr:hypothetical protein [Verrucomicrobiota bacterium]OQC65740.1 MAG: hypothetical protein BWX48_02217 [Verrucomicrobia bacterium ADurb.Bin006]NMD21288.1 hypothetical protein [Verrucomicrobiota bacterium]HOA62732.1 hypothetical protein [Verrucomicrobiota bacterium]HOF49860.1 hypothetical protein [Verrucomicrobiota bacterium]